MKKPGFTLVELMVVIAIFSILVALAIPSYQGSVRKSRRADAQSELFKLAGTAERVFNQFSSYENDDSGEVLEETADDIESAYYQFSATVTGTAYTITAQPQSTQTDDNCKVMTLTNTGVKANTGTSACDWK